MGLLGDHPQSPPLHFLHAFSYLAPLPTITGRCKSIEIDHRKRNRLIDST